MRLRKRWLSRYPGRPARIPGRWPRRLFDHLKEKIFRDDILNKRRRPDGRRFSEIRPDYLRSRLAAARPRFGPVYARRNPGDSHDDAGHQRRRAVHGRSREGRSQASLPAPLQLPALFSRRSRPIWSAFAPRDRPWRAGASGARGSLCRTKPLSRIPFASSRTSPSRTARRRWPRVCGGTLSMMDAGVPLKAPVAGVAMGLVMEGEQVRHPDGHRRC